MNKILQLCLIFISVTYAFSQNKGSVKYTLNYVENSDKVLITIHFDSLSINTVKLIIPRSAPGTYELTNYSSFVDNVKAYTSSNKNIEGNIGEGSYFTFSDVKNLYISSITYQVDISKMETTLLGSYASSKRRKNYVGILGYSVFGFVEGLEKKQIVLDINTARDWPIFSTLRPQKERKRGADSYFIENYAVLADGQYLLGKGVEIYQITNTKIPLFVAVYAETEINIREIGRRVLKSFNKLTSYFGFVPMPHYTVCYEFLSPISKRHDYGFSMEHLNSMTASFNISKAITNYDSNANIGSIVHHIAHSWIPLRSYGTGYRPFEWQTAPLIETIWLNEGFIWYISYYTILDNKQIIKFFNEILDNAPDYIKKKSLRELSLLGSTQYSMDFRIGKNLFSRGALLAHDLDILIFEETGGQKSFKDAILGLLKWTEVNKRAFRYDEIASIISKSVHVDVSKMWEKWQKPMR
ncbi:M61 family metallopeptidase [Lutibacter sp.]